MIIEVEDEFFNTDFIRTIKQVDSVLQITYSNGDVELIYNEDKIDLIIKSLKCK